MNASQRAELARTWKRIEALKASPRTYNIPWQAWANNFGKPFTYTVPGPSATELQAQAEIDAERADRAESDNN